MQAIFCILAWQADTAEPWGEAARLKAAVSIVITQRKVRENHRGPETHFIALKSHAYFLTIMVCQRKYLTSHHLSQWTFIFPSHTAFIIPGAQLKSYYLLESSPILLPKPKINHHNPMFLDNTSIAFISQGDLSIIATNCTVEKEYKTWPWVQLWAVWSWASFLSCTLFTYPLMECWWYPTELLWDGARWTQCSLAST